MRHKLREIVEQVGQALAQFGALEGLVVMESGRDVNDPYFLLSIDAYYEGAVKGPSERRLVFDFSGALEAGAHKDRFMLRDVPVRIEYRDLASYKPLYEGNYSRFVDDTYALRRLSTGLVFLDSAHNIEKLREKVNSLPQHFWAEVRELSASRLEHACEDMQAAALMEDSLYFTLSRARVFDGFVAVLCAANKAFLPSPRDYAAVLAQIPHIPEDFPGRLRTLLSWASEPMERQAELACLVSNEILAFSASQEHA